MSFLLAFERFWYKVSERSDFFANSFAFFFTPFGRSFELFNDGLDFFESSVDTLGTLFFRGFQGSGIGGELVEEGEGFCERSVDGGFVLGELLGSRRGDDGIYITLDETNQYII